MSTSTLAPAAVLADLDAHLNSDLEALLAFARIPSVSADPSHSTHVRNAAEFLAQRLRNAGPLTVTIHETPRHPVVTAEWRGAPHAPTILIYGHYDVQPPDPIDRWDSPPFEPQIREGRIYARGISDDKAPLMVPVTVVASYFRTTGRLPVNVVFLFEGEEEIGSPSLAPFVREHRDLLKANMVVSADGGMWRADHPSTMISARGLLAFELSVRGAKKDLHSGRHGGGLMNPLHALSVLIASLHDQDGRVAVAGFYDDVQPLSASLREATRQLPFHDADYLAEVGAPATAGEADYSTLERQWYRPTVEVNGMWGGYTGAGSKTVLPSEAHAKVTCRLVANQDPDAALRALTRHLESHAPAGVTVEIHPSKNGAYAYHLPEDHPGLQTVIASLEATYGVSPWVIGMGGSVPICATFQRELGMDTVFFSFAVGDEDIHAPNEFFRIARFGEGRRAWADYLTRLPKVMKDHHA
jgi:acetylornithine deacetylase/succinyl-diaminopimelate desuccinylase-like protein